MLRNKLDQLLTLEMVLFVLFFFENPLFFLRGE